MERGSFAPCMAFCSASYSAGLRTAVQVDRGAASAVVRGAAEAEAGAAAAAAPAEATVGVGASIRSCSPA